jgi:predicted ATPase with chaperone activity
MGESHVPLPDGVLLAHKGRLVLDALPDFRHYVLCTRAFAAFDTTSLCQFP